MDETLKIYQKKKREHFSADDVYFYDFMFYLLSLFSVFSFFS